MTQFLFRFFDKMVKKKSFSKLLTCNCTIFLVPNWADEFNFGAINCAQQDCDNFKIPGTPTLRLFYGSIFL